MMSYYMVLIPTIKLNTTVEVLTMLDCTIHFKNVMDATTILTVESHESLQNLRKYLWYELSMSMERNLLKVMNYDENSPHVPAMLEAYEKYVCTE